MQMLSEDDRNLEEMTDEELVLAWDLWFDLAQTTNASDPPYPTACSKTSYGALSPGAGRARKNLGLAAAHRGEGHSVKPRAAKTPLIVANAHGHNGRQSRRCVSSIRAR